MSLAQPDGAVSAARACGRPWAMAYSPIFENKKYKRIIICPSVSKTYSRESENRTLTLTEHFMSGLGQTSLDFYIRIHISEF